MASHGNPEGSVAVLPIFMIIGSDDSAPGPAGAEACPFLLSLGAPADGKKHFAALALRRCTLDRSARHRRADPVHPAAGAAEGGGGRAAAIPAGGHRRDPEGPGLARRSAFADREPPAGLRHVRVERAAGTPLAGESARRPCRTIRALRAGVGGARTAVRSGWHAPPGLPPPTLPGRFARL